MSVVNELIRLTVKCPSVIGSVGITVMGAMTLNKTIKYDTRCNTMPSVVIKLIRWSVC
jgi:hypothetical protein